MPYQVKAPLVLVRDGKGRHAHHYQGSVIPALIPEQAERLLRLGMVEKIDPPTEVEVDEGAAVVEVGGDVVRPPDVATKPIWVAYVVAKTAGTDKPVSAEEADKLTKDELVELYG